jgi:hypothetical protein
MNFPFNNLILVFENNSPSTLNGVKCEKQFPFRVECQELF